MSHNSNSDLLELASFHIDFWAGEGIGAVIENDIANHDLEALEAHIKESAGIMHDLEYRGPYNRDFLSPERAEDMYTAEAKKRDGFKGVALGGKLHVF